MSCGSDRVDGLREGFDLMRAACHGRNLGREIGRSLGRAIGRSLGRAIGRSRFGKNVPRR